MPRLSRLRLIGIGHPSARFDDLLLDLRDADGHATDTTLWLRNGGGKSSLLNLFFALLRPDRREFLGNRAEAKQRRLEDYVLKTDHSLVAAEWELDGDANADPTSSPVRLITGVFYEWRGASGAEAGQLRRLFFSTRVSREDPQLGLSDLPVFIDTPTGRRRRTLTSFREAWTELRMRHPHLELSHTENHREWKESLEAVGLDPEIFAYQIKMNQREGGADEVFRFADHDQFADFLLELVLDPSFGDKVATNIGTYRDELRLRKNTLLPEMDLVAGLAARLDPLVGIARRRDDLRGEAADVRRSVLTLGVHLSTRSDLLAGEAAVKDNDADAASSAAEKARNEALSEKRNAAAYRLFATERRRDAVHADLESARVTLTTAQRQLKLWTAAVPLAQALHHESAAAAALQQLEAKRAEHVPDLKVLARAATALAGTLEHAIGERTEAATRARNAESSLRSTARMTRTTAGSRRAHAATCSERARSLEQQILRAGTARGRLERDGCSLQRNPPHRLSQG